MRACRLLRIWYVWWGVSAMTANTLAMNSSGTFLWNRSDREFTKILAGFLQCMGSVRRWSRRLMRPLQSTPLSVSLVVPAKACAMDRCGLDSRMRAVLIA